MTPNINHVEGVAPLLLFLFVMRLNIVTDREDEVLDALNYAFASNVYGVRAYLANRPGHGIVEFDIVSDEPACISLENFREILPFIPEYNIRIRV